MVCEHPVDRAHHKVGDVGVDHLELLKSLKSPVVGQGLIFAQALKGR